MQYNYSAQNRTMMGKSFKRKFKRLLGAIDEDQIEDRTLHCRTKLPTAHNRISRKGNFPVVVIYRNICYQGPYKLFIHQDIYYI